MYILLIIDCAVKTDLAQAIFILLWVKRTEPKIWQIACSQAGNFYI